MTHYHHLDNIPVHTTPFGTLQLLSSAQMMIFWGKLEAGSHVPLHSHPNEQFTWLVSGRMDFRIDGEEPRSCGPGTIVNVPANVLHETWYREKCEIVECFNPPRFDLFPDAVDNPYGMR